MFFSKTRTAKAEVKCIVAGYGVYIDGKLALVCNHKANADLIARIYNYDDCHELFLLPNEY